MQNPPDIRRRKDEILRWLQEDLLLLQKVPNGRLAGSQARLPAWAAGALDNPAKYPTAKYPTCCGRTVSSKPHAFCRCVRFITSFVKSLYTCLESCFYPMCQCVFSQYVHIANFRSVSLTEFFLPNPELPKIENYFYRIIKRLELPFNCFLNPTRQRRWRIN